MNQPVKPREIAKAIFMAGVDRVRPARVMADLTGHGEFAADLAAAQRILVVGGGKAGAGMAVGLEDNFPHLLGKMVGVVNVPDDLVQPIRAVRLHPSRPIGVNEPTPAAAAGAAEMLALAQSATGDDVVVVLLSGGGSALLPAPVDGVSLADKIAVTRLMSAAGADIRQLNCVRKHLSRIKGGRLAEAAGKAKRVWGLIISDVVGDPLDVIASGPTAADPTTFEEAMIAVDQLRLSSLIPETVSRHLYRGKRGEIAETPKSLSANVRNHLLACNADALAATELAARQFGYDVINLGSTVTGESVEVATRIAELVSKTRSRVAILCGGETTVDLTSGGQGNFGSRQPSRGGRNQEFVLALALALDDLTGVTILSGGTDGEDGPTDAAGAFYDLALHQEAYRLGLDALDYLRRHDSYTFFERCGGLLKTGLTGTNVMDLRVILTEPM